MEAAQRLRMTLYCLGFSGTWSLSVTLATKGALLELQRLPRRLSKVLSVKHQLDQSKTKLQSNQAITLMSSRWNSYLLCLASTSHSLMLNE